MDFKLYGPDTFVCYKTGGEWSVYDVFLEALAPVIAWGAGTALGGLSPYLLARAATSFGIDLIKIETVEKLGSIKLGNAVSPIMPSGSCFYLLNVLVYSEYLLRHRCPILSLTLQAYRVGTL
jgi:hypothetical protein